MKRPLALFCLTWFAAQFVYTKLPPAALLPAAVFLLLAFIVILLRRKFRRAPAIIVCCALMAALCSHAGYDVYCMRVAAKLTGKPVPVTATVCTASGEKDGVNAVLRVQTVFGEPQKIPIMVRVGWMPYCEIGDEIRTVLFFSPATEKEKSNGRFLSAALQRFDLAVIGQSRAPSIRLAQLQQNLSKTLRSTLPKDLGRVAAAVCVGDKTNLTDSLYRTYRRAGLLHLLAVSGMHLSVITAVGLLPLPRTKPRLRLVMGMIWITAYAVLTGGAASVLRAGVMFGMVLLAEALSQDADSLTSLSLCAFLLTLKNPYAVINSGLLLSLAATAGVLFAGRITNPMRPHHHAARSVKIRFRAISLVLISAAATIATIPPSLATGTSVTIWSIASSVLTVPVLPILLSTGLLGALLGQFTALRLLARLPLALCALMVHWVQTVARFFSKIEFGRAYFFGEYATTVVALLFFGCMMLYFGVKNKRRFAVLLAGIFAFSCLVGTVFGRETVRATLLDGKKDPVIVLTSGKDAVVLWKGGATGTRQLEDCLEKQNIKRVVLFCDFSAKDAAKPKLAAYAPQQYCKIEEEVITGVTFSPFDAIIINIERQQQGTACTIDAGGVLLGCAFGETDFSAKADYAVFFAGEQLPAGLRTETILSGSPLVRAQAKTIKTGNGLCAFVRIGKSYRITEVNTGGDT